MPHPAYSGLRDLQSFSGPFPNGKGFPGSLKTVYDKMDMDEQCSRQEIKAAKKELERLTNQAKSEQETAERELTNLGYATPKGGYNIPDEIRTLREIYWSYRHNEETYNDLIRRMK